jgi:hypothetical protein
LATAVSSLFLLKRLGPIVDLALSGVLGEAVALLQLAGELLATAFHEIKVVVGQLALLLLHLAFDLLPVAFDAIPVHADLLLVIPVKAPHQKTFTIREGFRRSARVRCDH